MERIPTWLPVVALALRDAEGRWLLHRRPPGKHQAGLWEFPGGKVESGELPRQALVREIEEELGIIVEEWDLSPLGFADLAGDEVGRPIVLFLYTARKWVGNPLALEGGEAAWCTADQMHALPMPPLDRMLRDTSVGCRATRK